ncbi:hypothetical protein, partial [Ralstonia mannitolilytica]|uniref:hypothetical protein n=1 Tax=Ralstonia mannitolilytica TaxID=105219 RepID=UPI002931CFE3
IVAALFPIFDFLPRVAQQFCEGLRRIRKAPAQLLARIFGLTAFAQATVGIVHLQLSISQLDIRNRRMLPVGCASTHPHDS